VVFSQTTFSDQANCHYKMKHHLKIFFNIIIVTCGLSTNCKGDTIDNYQIYIGKTLKLTEASFNPLLSTIPFLYLDSSNYFEIININFSHCTHGASGRQLKLTDIADKTIMIWEFGDKEQKPVMSIPINEILTNPQTKSNSSFKLYYVDKEFPVWRLLTSVFVGQLEIKKREIKVSSNKFHKSTLLYIVSTLAIIFLVFIIARKISPNR
jgi:hypothetical protein